MRLLIADDHGIVRGGLKVLLEQQPDMTVVAEAEDGQQALEMALAHRPDLCVLDVSMPKLTGLQVAREIRAPVDSLSLWTTNSCGCLPVTPSNVSCNGPV